ncbi:MAG: glucose-6-phosphate isomerase [Phenylobacterium sp.]
MSDLSAAWTAFETAARGAEGRRIASLFDAEPDRLSRLTLEAPGLTLDLSKQPWALAEMEAGLALARAGGVEAAREAQFAGEKINRSEGRAALHAALRAPEGADFRLDGESISRLVDQTRAAMRPFAEALHSGQRKGASGLAFRTIVHIGIGGSDLGPRLVWEALRPLGNRMELRFAANVDPSELALALDGLKPAETLVVVVSKTFTTQETLANAQAARDWLRAALGPGADGHIIAVTAAPEKARDFGISERQTFGFWDWVGGRYSVWSAVSFACAAAMGFEAYAELLAGGAAMDEHFRTAPLERNAPVLLALSHIFNRNGLGRPTRAVIPYAHRLRLLPSWLQQLEMESNGKRVGQDGAPVARATAAAVFGEAGSTSQHAFFQQLHQGPDVIPLDIVAVREPREGDPAAHRKLLANAIAQAEALMVGRSEEDVRRELGKAGLSKAEAAKLAPQRTFPGDRPSNFLLLDQLTPRGLGALLALYEHKTFVEGVLWGINSFDQWGVELGKTLAGQVLGDLEGGAGAHDPSTAALIARVRG